MPTACIHQSRCSVHLKSERLEVWGPDNSQGREAILREIPIRDVDRLIISEEVQITSAALAALLRGGVPVSVLGWSGQFLGGFLPATKAHGLARLRQYQRTRDPGFALQMSGRIITAKLYNQRRVLQRLAASRNYDLGLMNSNLKTESGDAAHAQPDEPETKPQIINHNSEIRNTLQWLDSLFSSLSQSRTIDELRGYEGASTARYFQAWASFLPSEFPFERRSKRPPLNAVNACLSFGATLIYQEAVAFLHAHGLDPALGLLHNTEDGRWSLALDLIEPFRPVLVEALALDLFSHQILAVEHFESKNGGIYLNEDGRKKFLLQYERRMERQFMSECVDHRTTLRQQLENQAVMFKAALEEESRFEPFLMN
jgi:CRISPR-associated protein Cas1